MNANPCRLLNPVTVRALLVSAFTLNFAVTSLAVSVVSPNGQAAAEGNTQNLFPFSSSSSGLSSQRYQQVYNASDFALVSGPMLLTQIFLRPDAAAGSAFSSTLTNIQINLSTTSVGADGLSLIFANNVGLNDIVVFSGALSLSSADTGPVNGPKDFDIVINLTTPFLYDPSAGNLLLDVRNFGTAITTTFDAQQSLDAVSRVFTFDSGVNSATGDLADTIGLVTMFNFIPPQNAVPESIPSALGPLTLSFLVLVSVLIRRRTV